jgi:hypothetical protein
MQKRHSWLLVFLLGNGVGTVGIMFRLFNVRRAALRSLIGPQIRIKETVPRDYRLQDFFLIQFPPKHLSILLGPFQIFSKICGDILSSSCTTGVVVVDTGGK